jgi:NADH-quinone oxidoreductase subunit H
MDMLANLAKIVFCFVFFVLMLTPPLVMLERWLSAWMQGRLGPNRVDMPLLGRLGGLLPGGLGQPLADLVKNLFKEPILPAAADRVLYFMGPALVLIPAALGFIVIPFGSRIGDMPLQVADLGIGILFTMSVLSVSVYGLAFGGWASNSKYSLLGGLRASAQVISYELALSLSMIVVIMFAQSLDPQEIVRKQSAGLLSWNVFGGGNLWLAPSGLLAFILFFVAALAENNRLPFDLPECEAELVGGYHTEYSGMKFTLFMMGEYVAMILMCALMATFFLGGWTLPFGLNRFLDGGAWWQGALSVGVFAGKVVSLVVVYMVIRWTLPRFKYDQLMNLGWKRLVPLALANVALVAVVGVWTGGGK